MTIDIELNDKNLNKIKIKREEKTQIPIPIDKSSPEFKKKRKKKNIIILLSTLFVILSVLGFLIYNGYIFAKGIGFQFFPKTIFEKRDTNKLKRNSSGNFTNILLVGLDTRESGGLLNTDTIVLASYNYKTNNITLISIPRDFHVETAEDTKWFARINSIYSTAEQQREGEGIKELQKSVERLTGQEIQYYALIDFKSFMEIIDAVEGVDINVENSFTDYMYPKGNDYTTVSFKAGPQTMDGETALIYSRSRHSPHNNEGTDFARAKRQQKVIIALKDKILSSNSLHNPKALMSILSSISGNIRISDFTTTDIEGAFALAKKYEKAEGQTYSFVLDPSVGAKSLVVNVPMESGAYAIGPVEGLGKYDNIKEFVNLVLNKPTLYAENATVTIYDTGLGFLNAREESEKLKEQFPYTNILFMGTLFTDKHGTAIYSNDGNYRYSIKTFAKAVKADSKEKPEYINSNLNDADVIILLGKRDQLSE